MLANFPAHRGVDLLEQCDALGLARARRWLVAVASRPSTVQTTPARQSLVQLVSKCVQAKVKTACCLVLVDDHN